MRTFIVSSTIGLLALSAFAQDTNLRPGDIQAAIDSINIDQAINTLGLNDVVINDVNIAVTDDGESGEFAEEWNLNEEDDVNVIVDTGAVADILNQAAENIRNDPQGAINSVSNAISNSNNALSATAAELANVVGVSQADLAALAQQNQAAINNIVNSLASSANPATLEGQNTDQIIQTVADNLASLGIQLNTQA